MRTVKVHICPKLIMKNVENRKLGGVKQIRSPGDLITFARDYYSSDFSNPERKDCPETGIFKTLIQSENLPNDDVRNHLFSCSSCFTEYREVMAAYTKRHQVKPTSWWEFLLYYLKPKSSKAIAVAFLIFITTLSFLSIYINKHSRILPNSQNVPQTATGPINANLDR